MSDDNQPDNLTNNDSAKEKESKRRWANQGCLTFIIIYCLFLTVMYLTSTPTLTTNFSGRTAHEFSVAGVARNYLSDEDRYRIFNLERLNSGNIDVINITYLLPETPITIYVGDIHKAEILEDHGEWQLVAFHYSNTRTSTSVYRAFDDRIEPVSYALTSSVGHVFGAMVLFLPAVLLSAVVTAIRKRVFRKAG